MGRMSTGWRLAKASWRVLVRDQSLLFFPVLSFLSGAVALGVFLVPGVMAGTRADSNGVVIFYGVIGAYAATFCSIYFNVALAGAAHRSMAGHDTTVRQGLAVANERKWVIASWALVQLIVGLALNALQSNDDSIVVRVVSRLVTALLGTAWGIATFLIVPVLAFEGLDPGAAFKRSLKLVRARWGEGLAGNVGISMAVTLLGGAPSVLLIALGAWSYGANPSAASAAIGIGAAGVIATLVISSALNVIFRVELYRYAMLGTTTGAFSEDDLAASFTRR
jgi:riboflavin transporter FmnP